MRPPSESSSAVRPSWHSLATLGARPPLWLALALCTAVLAARRPDAFVSPQLWAEDGIFFHQAYTHGARAFLLELAGYFHLVPRFIAALAVALDPRWVPTVFVGSALVCTLYVASRLCSARCPLPLPGVCALAVVLVPDAGEVLMTTVNIQWVLAGALLLLLISREPTRLAGKLHDGLAALVLGLTGPFSIVLTPLFILRAWRRRTAVSTTLAAIVAGCAVIQLVSIFRHPLPAASDPAVDLGALVSVPGARVGGSLLLGRFLPKPVPFALAVGLTVVTLQTVTFLGLRRGALRDERLWLGVALLALLAASLFRYRHSLPSLLAPGGGSRYFFAVQLGVLWLVVSATVLGHRFAVCARVVLGLVLLVNVTRLREGPMTDLHWENYVAALRAGEEVTITVNPGWKIALPARPRR